MSIEVACDDCCEEFDSRMRHCPGCFDTAILSIAGRHRYWLRRHVAEGEPEDPETCVCFIMLNPSTADAAKDDPTIRKCRGFAERWGCTSLEVVNLFSFRATKPRDLWLAADPIGPDCDQYLFDAVARSHTLVAAWGVQKNRRMQARARHVCAELAVRFPGRMLCSIGEPSMDGHPQHPLMLAYALPLQEWRPS